MVYCTAMPAGSFPTAPCTAAPFVVPPLGPPVRAWSILDLDGTMSLVPFARSVASRLGVLPRLAVAYRTMLEWSPGLALRNARLRREWRGSVPLPPGDLMFGVTRSRDVQWFLETGQASTGWIRSAVAEVGRPIERFRSVLDFGCGCGRVLRHWGETLPGRIHGCDQNAEAVAWARENLPFARLAVNAVTPPLPYESGAFDCIYTISVFTHIPAELQRPWMNEMRRVLEPGGILLVTLNGEYYLSTLRAGDRDRFRAGELVVYDADYVGTNYCNAYHPDSYVRRELTEGFEILAHRPRGATGSPHQDVWVLRKPHE